MYLCSILSNIREDSQSAAIKGHNGVRNTTRLESQAWAAVMVLALEWRDLGSNPS